MRILWACCALFSVFSTFSPAQAPKKYTASEIHHELQKLNFLGTALYVAAHPDDENTRLISYLSNEVRARTVYLSLTRGDGGQNLIGPELRELLGVLRTQELLGARGVDGGEQRFSRANDFGYSKHPEETLQIWDKDKVLSDMVWAIRTLKPDVIVNRFDHRTPGTTHGHHTASAMLSYESFELASDPSKYTDQLSETTVWQPKRLFFNTSWWFYGSRDNFAKADKSRLLEFDVGVYYPNLGVSNNEIASMASSQHKCQGFGRLLSRGSQPEYLELLKGDLPDDRMNIFDGIDTSWSRIPGGEAVGAILYRIEQNFNFKNPGIHLPELVRAYQLLQNVDDTHWKEIKSKHLKEIILACGGIYLEANAQSASAIPGQSVTLDIEVLNRSETPIRLNRIVVLNTEASTTPEEELQQNVKRNYELRFAVPQNSSYTTPYWLNGEGTLGMYSVSDNALIGQPETPKAFEITFDLVIDGVPLEFTKPVVHRFSKPDIGELYEPFVVLPKVTASFSEDVFLFNTTDPVNIDLAIRAGADDVNGIATLDLPSGWVAQPAAINFAIQNKGAIQNVTFQLVPPQEESVGVIQPVLTVDGNSFGQELVEIEYKHIPKQSILLPSTAKVVRMDIKKVGKSIGYIVGAGDKVPESLSQIGYEVETIDVNAIEKGSLNKFDGIVLGIRAYNVVEALEFKQPYLLEYVKNGGNMIVQYNTANRWRSQFSNIAPYPLTISRDRVTDENAAVEILAKGHELVNFPNEIVSRDFEGWVQERGLYFPNSWGEEFTPILTMNDKGETPKEGSLLVAPYGEGYYIYTGLSFFRELPAGVPGAYKLFANMLSLGKGNTNDKKQNDVKG
ncbi:MAG: PIG-L family deacetylase [Bacteroidota bacterium]